MGNPSEGLLLQDRSLPIERAIYHCPLDTCCDLATLGRVGRQCRLRIRKTSGAPQDPRQQALPAQTYVEGSTWNDVALHLRMLHTYRNWQHFSSPASTSLRIRVYR